MQSDHQMARMSRPQVGDRVETTLVGVLTAYDAALGHWTLRGNADGARHVPWTHTLHWATSFRPVDEERAEATS